MKHYKLFLVFILLIFAVQVKAESDNIVKISIQSLIVVGKTKTATGKITSLSNKAVTAGYDELMLKGTIKYNRLSDGSTRVTINWGSAKKYNGTSEINESLASSLVSQFTTTDKKVQPNTELSARGDLDSLAKTMDQLANEKGGATPGSGNGDESESGGSTKAASSNVSSPSTVASDNIEGENTPSSGDVNSGAETKLVTYEACAPRIDKVGGKVYQQAAKVTTGADTGTEISRDACADKGAVADIVQDYSGCGTLEDIASGFVYAKYQEYADLDGSRVQVTNCTTDFAKKWTVHSTYEGCAVRHDFINNKSIQKEQFYYLDDSNSRTDLGECVDSDIEYAHSLTLNTCTASVDEVNGYVFPEKRVMYTNSSGTIEYATECAPVTSEQVALSVESCPQKYEHDFNAGQSYKRIQKFYTDFQTSEKILVGACTRDTTVSYPHIHNQASCTTEYDDANLMNIWNSNTQIDLSSEGEGILEIAPCAQYGNPTPYLFVDEGYKQKSRVFTAISTLPANNTCFLSGDSSSREVPITTYVNSLSGKTWDSGGTASDTYFTPKTSEMSWNGGNWYVQDFACRPNYGNNEVRQKIKTARYTWELFKRYKRGDNSLYDFSTGAVISNTFGAPRVGVKVLP